MIKFVLICSSFVQRFTLKHICGIVIFPEGEVVMYGQRFTLKDMWNGHISQGRSCDVCMD